MKIRSIYLLVGIVAAFLMASATAFAYGSAGCGLGSVVFQKNTIVSQSLASTTNATFYSQLFGITSGTSNCQTDGFAMINKQKIFYAESNYRDLIVEMAQGKGETLDGLAQLMGCRDQAIPEFGAFTRKNYQKIIPSEKTTPVEMLQSLQSQLRQNPTLVRECSQIG